jgi:hypothetical protein
LQSAVSIFLTLWILLAGENVAAASNEKSLAPLGDLSALAVQSSFPNRTEGLTALNISSFYHQKPKIKNHQSTLLQGYAYQINKNYDKGTDRMYIPLYGEMTNPARGNMVMILQKEVININQSFCKSTI